MKKFFQTRIVSALLGYAVLAIPFATYSYADNAMKVGTVRQGKETVCSAADKARGCNECFESRTLRYGYVYELINSMRNPEKNPIYIEEGSFALSRGALINNKGINNELEYSDWIANKNYILNPKDSGEIVSIKNFSIDNLPSEGRKSNNMIIEYIFDFQKVENNKPVGNLMEHTTCQPYEISWCGDGVLDKEYGEMCDAKDLKRQGWGLGGCDERTCKPIDKKSGIDWFKKNANPAS